MLKKHVSLVLSSIMMWQQSPTHKTQGKVHYVKGLGDWSKCQWFLHPFQKRLLIQGFYFAHFSFVMIYLKCYNMILEVFSCLQRAEQNQSLSIWTLTLFCTIVKPEQTVSLL